MKIYSSEVIKNKLANRKKIKTIFKGISYIIAIIIVICAIYILYQKFIEKNDNINLFGYRPYVVLSGSMEPSLSVGDIIIAKNVEEEQIKVNDIVTYIDGNGTTVTHRIIDIIIKDGKKYYQTKGDNNNSTDVGLISFENIRGQYSLKINKAGQIINGFMTPAGLIVLVLIISLIYMNTTKKSDRKIARHIIRERYKNQSII